MDGHRGNKNECVKTYSETTVTITIMFNGLSTISTIKCRISYHILITETWHISGNTCSTISYRHGQKILREQTEEKIRTHELRTSIFVLDKLFVP